MDNNKKYESLKGICDFYGCKLNEEKTVENLIELLSNNNIDYKLVKHTEHRDNTVVEFSVVEVDINSNGDYLEVSVEDGNFEYSVVAGLNRNVLEDHCSLTKYLYKDDNKLINLLNNCIGNVKTYCDMCQSYILLKDEYNLQKCPICGENTIPYESRRKIVVGEIQDVSHVNTSDDYSYDFQMDFNFENEDMIKKHFFDIEECGHFIGCMVDKKDGFFDLDNCVIELVFHCNYSQNFPFTDEQIRTIKDKVIKEIKDNNMGEIKDSEDKNYLIKEYGEYGIPFKQIRKLDCYSMSYDLEFSKMKEYVFSFDEDGENGSTEVLAVLELGNFDIEFCEYGYTEKGNLDTGFFCCAKYKETGWQSEGFADLEVYEEMFDSKDKFEEEMYKAMIEYMKKEGFKWSEENSNDIEDNNVENKEYFSDECFNNVSSLDVRFTVGATYKGLVNVGLHDIDFTIGVPFVNNYGQLKMATRVLVSLDLDNAKVHIINVISSDKTDNSVQYWIGVSTEEISELLYNTVQKNNLTSNYIEIQNKEGRTKRMQVKTIEDLIKLDKVDGMIVGANIEDKSLENQIKKYINQDLSSLTEDCLDFLNGKLKGSLDLFEKLLNRESLSYWMHEAEVYTYETDNVCYAIEYFLEDNANIPYEALEYMDCKGYFDNVVRCETLKSEDGYVAILDR